MSVEPAVVMSEFRRSRILMAALTEAAVRGYRQTSVTAIVDRARVSRKTFYDVFEDRHACYGALFDEAVAQIGDVVVAPYLDIEGKWSERVREALGALLEFLERDRDLGAFVLEYVLDSGNDDAEARVWLLEHLRSVAADGRSQAKARLDAPPLTDEAVVGAVLAILHARLRDRATELTGLLNPLMWLIVLPYSGPAVAAMQLQQEPPRTSVKRARSAKGPLEGLEMRVTYRTARVLAAIADEPGGSNTEIAAEVEVSDAGQISKLLARLEGLGLVANHGAGHAYGAANEWHLTFRGAEVDRAIRHQFAAGRPFDR